MLGLLRKEVICKTLDAHTVKFFDIDTATDRLQMKPLKLSSFLQRTATFVERKANSAFVDQNKVFAKASKKEPMAAKELNGGIIEKLPIQLGSGSKEPLRSWSFTRRSKLRHAK